MLERDEKIRQRAYEIWEAEGRPDGRHDEHWERASREIDTVGTGDGEDQAGEPPPRPRRRRPAAEGGSSSGLQPGGVSPGRVSPRGGPAAGNGSIGSGGATTAGRASGSVKSSGR